MTAIPKTYEIEGIQNLLKVLSENFSEKTKYYELPYGTRTWFFYIVDGVPFSLMPDVPATSKMTTILVNIIPFFGTHCGYCPENDTLYFWASGKGER